MNRRTIARLTSLPWQVAISLLFTGIVAVAIYLPSAGVNLGSVDRATFISALSAIATLVALFCSLSLTWILFTYQQVKAQRTAAYDLMKQCLMEAESWLHSMERTESREICLSLLWEIDQIEHSNIPQLGSIPEYEAYCKALDTALDSEDADIRLFFQRSIFHFKRIEQLLARFGLASIQQVLVKVFIDTLAKGFAIVAFSVFILMCAMLWFGDGSKPWYILAVAFVSSSTILVLFEVWLDLLREYEEELDFVENSAEA